MGGGGNGRGTPSALSSSLADICADDGVWKLCCVSDSLMCIIWAPVCDSESVGVLLGLLLLKWLSDEPALKRYKKKSTVKIKWLFTVQRTSRYFNNLNWRLTRMCGRCIGHIFGVRPLLAAVIKPIQHIEHGLWILLLLLFADVRVHQQSCPCFWHSL